IRSDKTTSGSVLRIHKDVSVPRIDRRTAPIRTACESRKHDRWGHSVGLQTPRAVRTFIIEFRFFPKLAASLLMFGRRVGRSDNVVLRDRDPRHRRRLYGNRLRGRVPFAGNVALWYGPFFDRIDRFAGLAIENEHET